HVIDGIVFTPEFYRIGEICIDCIHRNKIHRLAIWYLEPAKIRELASITTGLKFDLKITLSIDRRRKRQLNYCCNSSRSTATIARLRMYHANRRSTRDRKLCSVRTNTGTIDRLLKI